MVGGRINPEKVKRAQEILKCPLGKRARQILDFMMAKDREMYASDIERAINESDKDYLVQSSAAVGFNKLLDCNYLILREDGVYRYYSVNWDHIEKVNRIAKELNNQDGVTRLPKTNRVRRIRRFA